MAFMKRTTTKKEDEPKPKAVKKVAIKKTIPPSKKLSEVLDPKPVEVTEEVKAVEPVTPPQEDEQLELPLEEVLDETPVVEEKPMVENIAPPVMVNPVVTPPKVQEAPMWRKKPRTGDHKMPNGTVISGTMVVKAWPEELGAGLDKFVRLTPAGDGDRTGPPPPAATLFVKEREGGGFDVVNAEGVPINATSLTKEEADSLVNGITA
jgi:hypothetical protein